MGVALEKEPPRPHSHEKWLIITTNSYKFPECDRHDVVENTRTKDIGLTEKMVAPPPFQKNIFSQDYENIRFIYPLPFLLKQM